MIYEAISFLVLSLYTLVGLLALEFGKRCILNINTNQICEREDGMLKRYVPHFSLPVIVV